MLIPPSTLSSILQILKAKILTCSSKSDGKFEIFVEGAAQPVRIEIGGIKQLATSVPPTEIGGAQFAYLGCFLKKIAAPVQSTSPPTVATGRLTAAEQGLWKRWTVDLAEVPHLLVHETGPKARTYLSLKEQLQRGNGVKLVVSAMATKARGFHARYKSNNIGVSHPQEATVCGNVCATFWKEKIGKKDRKLVDEEDPASDKQTSKYE